MFSQASVILFTEGGGCAWQGVCMAGGMCGRGHAWQGDVCGGGGMHGRSNGHCSGQYASYWNAFLLSQVDTPPGQTPQGRYPTPGQTPPPSILRDTVYKRAERILLECILIDNFLLCCILNYSRSRSHRVISRSNCKIHFLSNPSTVMSRLVNNILSVSQQGQTVKKSIFWLFEPLLWSMYYTKWCDEKAFCSWYTPFE